MNAEPIQVLLIEDSPADARFVQDELKHAPSNCFSVMHVEFLKDAVNLLKKKRFDVALLDLSLPDSQGFETFSLLHSTAPQVPILILSGRSDEDLAFQFVQAGAQDTMVKGELTEDRLARSIRYAIERKRSENRALEQASQLDHPHDAIIVCAIHTGRITFWSHGAQRLYGWTAAEAKNNDIGELLFIDPAAPNILTQALLRDGEWRGDVRHKTKDGGEVMVSSHLILVHDALGVPESALVINIDLTREKLLGERLLRAQRMESIGNLAGGIAHDLNNVLAPILLSVELMKTQIKNPQRLKTLSSIADSTRRGADLVRQVLSFARGDEGQRAEVHLGSLLREVAKIGNDTFLKTIRVHCDIAPDLWVVQADATQLRQVLLNLCVNARDAMPGGGTLRLSAKNKLLPPEDPGINHEPIPSPHVVIEVTDTGSGMPPKVIERIFDPFFTTKEPGLGTGLGLSISMGIVKSHYGFIRVHSQLGVGTRFRVYLPAQTTATLPAPAPVQPQTSKELLRGNGELVLVVDDERLVREVSRQILENFGYRVLLAGDGADATSIFSARKHEIALVIIDMMMPLIDGPMIIEALLRMNPTIPVIAVSGLNTPATRDKASRAGVKHFLPKPYNAQTLLTLLRSVLDAPPPAGSSETVDESATPNPTTFTCSVTQSDGQVVWMQVSADNPHAAAAEAVTRSEWRGRCSVVVHSGDRSLPVEVDQPPALTKVLIG